MKRRRQAEAIVIGGSAGSFESLNLILPALSGDRAPPAIVVIHLPPNAGPGLCQVFTRRCKVNVLEAEDKMSLEPATVYFAPANYHLLVERGRTLALSL